MNDVRHNSPPDDASSKTFMESPVSATPPRGSQVVSDTAVTIASGALLDAPAALPMAQLKHYRLLDLIGRGGMGDVYRAHDEQFHRIVALKVLPADLGNDPTFVRRFQREAQSLAKLSHPNIVPIYTIDEDQGHWFFAMQFVDGESLDRRLRRMGKLPFAATLRIVSQCLAALQAAHDQRLVHRDVKPGNVLLEKETNHVFLVDFGLVRRVDGNSQFTSTGMVMGTVDYMSPEQARGAKGIDHRSDLYSLGVMLYHMVAGRLPFEAPSFQGMLYSHAYEEPFPLETAAPDSPAPLVALVKQLLAKSPNDRPSSCREVLAAIEPLLQIEARAQHLQTELTSAADDLGSEPLQLAASIVARRRWADRIASLVGVGKSPSRKAQQSLHDELHSAIAAVEQRIAYFAGLKAEGEQLCGELRQQAIDDANAGADISDVEANSFHGHAESIGLRLMPIELELNRAHDLRAKLAAVVARAKLIERPSKGSKSNIALAIAVGVCLLASVGLVAAIASWFGRTGRLSSEVSTLPADVYLDDYPEAFAHVGHGSLGKHGNTGYAGASGEIVLDVVVDGKEFKHALSTHPGKNDAAMVSYDLGGNYRSFTTRVGLIDKLTAGHFQGEMIFRVLGDDRELWRSPSVRKHGQSIGTAIDVTGVQRLSLVVECLGPYYCGWAVWLEPKLSATAIPDSWRDLLANVDIQRDRVFGSMQREQNGIRFLPNERTLLALPANWPAQYDIEFDFSRQGHGGGMELVVPVGDRLCNVDFGGWGNRRHGIYRIQGQDHFPGAFRIGTIEAAKRHRATVQVRQRGATATIVLWLNSEKVVAWSGNVGDLSLHKEFELAQPGRVSASTFRSDITLHSARWRIATDQVEQAKPKEDVIYRKLQPGETMELLPLVKLPDDVVLGQWRVDDQRNVLGAISLTPFTGHARLQLPVRPRGDFEVTLRYTILNGHDMNVVFPAGHESARAIFGFWPEGSLVTHNPGEKRIGIEGAVPSTNGSRKMHVARIVVETLGDRSAIKIYVDGTLTCDWQGENRLLANNPPCQIHDPRAVGLTTHGEPHNCFHSLSLRMLSGHAEIGRPEQLAASGALNILERAQEHGKLGELAQARDKYEELIRLEPDQHYRRGELAALCLALRDEAEYRRHCQILLDHLSEVRKPDDRLHVLRILFLAPGVADRWSEAEQEQIFRSERESEWKDRVRTLWHYRHGRWQPAIDQADAYLAAHQAWRERAQCMVIRAMALWHAGQQPLATTALTTAEQYIALQSAVTTKWNEAANLIYLQIYYREATKLIRGRSEELRFNREQSSIRPSQEPTPSLLLQSRAALDAAIAAKPNESDLYLQRGHWYAIRHMWKEACVEYELSLQHRPDAWWCRADLARAYLFQGDLPAYERHCNVLLEQLASQPDVGTQVHMMRPLCLQPSVWQKSLDEFTPRADRQHKIDPHDGEVLRTLIELRYRQRRWLGCIEAVEQLLPNGVLHTNDGYPWLFRIMAKRQLGETATAQQELAKFKAFMEAQLWNTPCNEGYDKLPADKRLKYFTFNAMEAQIVYREASALILGSRAELHVPPALQATIQPSP